jgi:putative spermidine/putrescine transport system permease protein
VETPQGAPNLVGVAILRALRQIGLRDAYASLLVGHVVITLPYVTRTVLASLSLFDFTLIEAARTLGCSYPRALLKGMVPVLAPAFLPRAL